MFSPAVKNSSISVLLDIVVMKNLKLKQLHVNIKLLYGELDEEIYMKQPNGFKIMVWKTMCVSW